MNETEYKQRIKELEQAIEAYSLGEKNALARAERAENNVVELNKRLATALETIEALRDNAESE